MDLAAQAAGGRQAAAAAGLARRALLGWKACWRVSLPGQQMCSKVSQLGCLKLRLLDLEVCFLLPVLGALLVMPVKWSKQGFLPLCCFQLHRQGCLGCWDCLKR